MVARKEREYLDMGELPRQKELAGVQDRQHLYRAQRNGAWLSAIPHQLDSMELSQEEL